MSREQSSVRDYGGLPDTEQVTFDPDAPVKLGYGDVAEFYDGWPAPDVIIADGPTLESNTASSTATAASLRDWYQSHISAWTQMAPSGTALWFWTTHETWAVLNDMFDDYGWSLQAVNTWVKGSDVATTPSPWAYPSETEVCAYYVRGPYVTIDEVSLPAAQWFTSEWTRADLDRDDLAAALSDDTEFPGSPCSMLRSTPSEWVPPTPDVFEAVVEYANTNGDDDGPVFTTDATDGPMTAAEWGSLLPTFTPDTDMTDVWECPPPTGEDRLTTASGTNPGQKPATLMRQLVDVSSTPDDIVWEPFGGFCTGAAAAKMLGREAVAAEHRREVYEVARNRLDDIRFGRGIDNVQSGLDSFTR